MTGRSQFEISNRRGAANVFSDNAVTFTAAADASVTGTSAALVAAGSGTSRYVIIYVPNGATTGIRINFGATAADATSPLIEPGERVYLNTIQAVNAIRAGASNVTVSIFTGVPT